MNKKRILMVLLLLVVVAAITFAAPMQRSTRASAVQARPVQMAQQAVQQRQMLQDCVLEDGEIPEELKALVEERRAEAPSEADCKPCRSGRRADAPGSKRQERQVVVTTAHGTRGERETVLLFLCPSFCTPPVRAMIACVEGQMAKTLILYATKHGTTHACAEVLQKELKADADLQNLIEQPNVDLGLTTPLSSRLGACRTGQRKTQEVLHCQ